MEKGFLLTRIWLLNWVVMR